MLTAGTILVPAASQAYFGGPDNKCLCDVRQEINVQLGLKRKLQFFSSSFSLLLKKDPALNAPPRRKMQIFSFTSRKYMEVKLAWPLQKGSIMKEKERALRGWQNKEGGGVPSLGGCGSEVYLPWVEVVWRWFGGVPSLGGGGLGRAGFPRLRSTGDSLSAVAWLLASLLRHPIPPSALHCMLPSNTPAPRSQHTPYKLMTY